MTDERKTVKINIPDNLKNGVYSNIANIVVSKREVLIDFVFLAPPNEPNLVSRVIITLEHARELEKALAKLIMDIDNKVDNKKE